MRKTTSAEFTLNIECIGNVVSHKIQYSGGKEKQNLKYNTSAPIAPKPFKVMMMVYYRN